MSKIDVKGAGKHDLYKHLIAETKGAEISWNFEKFLIGPDGKVISRYKPKTKPNDKKLLKAIENALSKL